MGYRTRRPRMPLGVKFIGAAGTRSWRGARNCRPGRWLPGGSTIAGQWGTARMPGREHPKYTLVHPPICAMIADAQHVW